VDFAPRRPVDHTAPFPALDEAIEIGLHIVVQDDVDFYSICGEQGLAAATFTFQ
jgi:hypothetical protein